jgi:hypothetical protein
MPGSGHLAFPAQARAASQQLSDGELAELAEENRKLRSLLEADAGRLPADQVDALRRQYDDIRALAAANGLAMDPLAPADGEEVEASGGSTHHSSSSSSSSSINAASGSHASGIAAPPAQVVGSSPAVTAAKQQQWKQQAAAAAAALGAAASQAPAAAAEEADHWVDERGRGGGDYADRMAPQLGAQEKVGPGTHEVLD